MQVSLLTIRAISTYLCDGYNGNVFKEIKCECDHGNYFTSCICEQPVDPDGFIETCPECSKIRSYNKGTGHSKDIFTEAAICTGPSGSILGVDDKGCILQFKWKDDSEDLTLLHSLETHIEDARYMCFVEDFDSVVFSCDYPDRICDIALSDGSTQWEFNQKVKGKIVEPHGLCHKAK